jgi:hypothetical protein
VLTGVAVGVHEYNKRKEAAEKQLADAESEGKPEEAK